MRSKTCLSYWDPNIFSLVLPKVERYITMKLTWRRDMTPKVKTIFTSIDKFLSITFADAMPYVLGIRMNFSLMERWFVIDTCIQWNIYAWHWSYVIEYMIEKLNEWRIVEIERQGNWNFVTSFRGVPRKI